jgi:hypothetical protein
LKVGGWGGGGLPRKKNILEQDSLSCDRGT